MCNACVIDSVKRRMLSRRDMLKGLAVGSVGAVASGVTGLAGSLPSSLAMGHENVHDMTHELHEAFPTYFGEQQFFAEQKFAFADNGFNLLELRVNEHSGTHIDAPLHFSADGASVAEIPVSQLVCPLCVIDIRERAAENADAQVTPEDIDAWIEANGEIPANACVAMNSGWADRANGDGFRNVDGETMHFPGFHQDATAKLLEESEAAGLAVDTLSLDFGQSQDFATHYAWLPTGRWGIECLANLDAVPAAGATLVVGAPKHRGGTGGPSRVFAFV